MGNIIDKRFTFADAEHLRAYRGKFIDHFMDHFGVEDPQRPDSFVLRDLLQKTTEHLSPARSRQLHEQITRRFRDSISEDRIIDTDEEYSILFNTVIEIHMENIRTLVENSSSREAWLRASPETIKSLFTLMVMPLQLKSQLMSEQMAMARSLIRGLDLGPLKEHDILERLFNITIAGQSGGHIVTQLALFMTDFNIEGNWQDVLITMIRDYPEQIDNYSFLLIIVGVKKGFAEKLRALLFQKPIPPELDAQLYQRIAEDIRLLPILAELGHPVAMRALQEIIDGDENSRVVQLLQKKMAEGNLNDVDSLTSAIAVAIEATAAYELGEGSIVDQNWAGEYEVSSKKIVEALKRLIRKRGKPAERPYLGMIFFALLSTAKGKQFFYREETVLKEKLGKKYKQPDFINIAAFIEEIPDIRTSPIDILTILKYLKPLLEAEYNTWLRRLEEFAGKGDELAFVAIYHILDATLINTASPEMGTQLFDFFDSGLDPESFLNGMRELMKLPSDKRTLPGGDAIETDLKLSLDRLMTSRGITRTFQKTFEAVRLLTFEFPDVFGEWGAEVMGELDRQDRYDGSPIRVLTDMVMDFEKEFLISETAWRQIKANAEIAAIKPEGAFGDYLPYLFEIAEDANGHTLDAAHFLIMYANGEQKIKNAEDRQAILDSLPNLNLDGILSHLEYLPTVALDTLTDLALLNHTEALHTLLELFEKDYTSETDHLLRIIISKDRPDLHQIILEEMVSIVSSDQSFSPEIKAAATDIILYAADQDIPGAWAAVGKIAETNLKEGRLNESTAARRLLETDSVLNSEEQTLARTGFDTALGTYITERYNPISGEVDQMIIDWVRRVVSKLDPAQSLQALSSLDRKLATYIDSLDPETANVDREKPYISITIQRLKSLGLTSAYNALRAFRREKKEIERMRREAARETGEEAEAPEEAGVLEYEEPLIINDPVPFPDEQTTVGNYIPMSDGDWQLTMDSIFASTTEDYGSLDLEAMLGDVMFEATSFFDSFETINLDMAFERIDDVTDTVWSHDVPIENAEYVLEALIKSAKENKGARIKLSELIKECKTLSLIAADDQGKKAIDMLYFIAITARDIYPRFGEIAKESIRDISQNLASPQRMRAIQYLAILEDNFA